MKTSRQYKSKKNGKCFSTNFRLLQFIFCPSLSFGTKFPVLILFKELFKLKRKTFNWTWLRFYFSCDTSSWRMWVCTYSRQDWGHPIRNENDVESICIASKQHKKGSLARAPARTVDYATINFLRFLLNSIEKEMYQILKNVRRETKRNKAKQKKNGWTTAAQQLHDGESKREKNTHRIQNNVLRLKWLLFRRNPNKTRKKSSTKAKASRHNKNEIDEKKAPTTTLTKTNQITIRFFSRLVCMRCWYSSKTVVWSISITIDDTFEHLKWIKKRVFVMRSIHSRVMRNLNAFCFVLFSLLKII